MRRVAVAALVAAGLVGLGAYPASAHMAIPLTVDFESGNPLTTGAVLAGTCPSGAGALTATISTALAHTGTKSLAITGTDTGDCAVAWNGSTEAGATPVIVSGHTYNFSVWVRVPSGAAPFGGRVVARDGTGVGYGQLSPNYSGAAKDVWTNFESVFTPSTGSADFSVRFYTSGGRTMYVDDISFVDLTGQSSAPASTCTTTATGACKVDITNDSGGFFGTLSSGISGIGSGVASALSSPLTAIKDAVDSLWSFIVNGFSSLLLPSTSTTSGIGSMWVTASTKFPFSVATELVTLPAATLGAIQSGIAAGPPSDCSSYLCGSTGAISAVSVYAPVSTLRNIVGFVLVAMFAYGVLRSIGQAIK